MKLWTWQNPKFDITSPNTPVESKKYSEYLNCDSRGSIEANNHLNKYEILWSILRTDQFHWYYTDKKEATNNCSYAEYGGNVLWELDIPEDKVLKKICYMTWYWILDNRDAPPPKTFECFFKVFWQMNIYDRTTFSDNFNKYWRDMKSQQLWKGDCLFCDCGVQQCYQVLVRHPIDGSWVIKNPQKDINWWQKH